MPEPKKHILIVGGGLAGIAAAVALASRAPERLAVTLLESRHALGGRAGSFQDPETGELLDNCQHVLLGCCTNLLDLYQRLGVSDKITFHKTVHFLDPAGRRHDLAATPGLPAPLHLGLAFLRFSALTPRERVAVIKQHIAMLRIGKSGRNVLDSVSFGQWLADRGTAPSINDAIIRKFYDPILISALNEQTRRASAKYAIQVFQDAMLANATGYLVGLPNCPLGELYASVPGVNVRVNTRVDEVLFEHTKASVPTWRATGVRLRDQQILWADAVILATNHHAVQRWIPEYLQRLDARFPPLALLQNVPILGAHLWFDRPIMSEPAAALIEPPHIAPALAGILAPGGGTGGLQWLFRKDPQGKTLHGVISAARDWPTVPKGKALAQFEQQIRQLFPAAKEAKLLRGTIVIERRATFSPLPNTDSLRPEQGPPAGGGIRNLYLAGDYTKTDWPATMEGAVRSGYLAAEALLDSLATPTPILQPDLPIQWPARLLGLQLNP